MKSYVLVEIHVEEPEGFMEYRERIGELISKYGGKYIVRGGETVLLLGDMDVLPRVVVLEFPSREQTTGFFQEREEIGLKDLFERSTRSRIIMVDGYESDDG